MGEERQSSLCGGLAHPQETASAQREARRNRTQRFPPARGTLEDSPVLSSATESLDPMLSKLSCLFASLPPELCHLFGLKALWEQELSLPVCLDST